MSVHRLTPLPEGPAVGCLVVAEAVIERTGALLRDSGTESLPHERLVWWLGRRMETDTLVLACHRPPSRSTPQSVRTDEAAAGAASRLARARRLGIVAQVHSHPGLDTCHSDGDDVMVLMPFEGMFSLVVANYGRGSLLPDSGAGLHQFQDGRWVLVRQPDPVLLLASAEVAS